MANPVNPYQQYRSVRIETASHQNLVLMAYDGIIGCLHETQASLEKQPRDIETATKQLIKAQQILEALFDGLNFNAGEVAYMLGSFYAFLQKFFAQANMTKDPADIQKALDLVHQVKGFWQKQEHPLGSDIPESDSLEPPSFDSLR